MSTHHRSSPEYAIELATSPSRLASSTMGKTGARTSLPRKRKIDARLTEDECARLERFMAAHGLNRSQALRSLINLALEGSRVSDGAALSKKVYREGYDAGVS